MASDYPNRKVITLVEWETVKEEEIEEEKKVHLMKEQDENQEEIWRKLMKMRCWVEKSL